MTLASQNKMWWLALFAMLIVILLAFPAEASRMLDENVKVNRGPNFERLNFGMLPRGAIVPPSGPSRGLSPGTPPLPPHRPENVNFGMIPKILQKTPPSGPSHRTSDPPPPPSRSERIN